MGLPQSVIEREAPLMANRGARNLLLGYLLRQSLSRPSSVF